MSPMRELPTLGLYVHVPFCLRRCFYCDFASEPLGGGHDRERVGAYLKAVALEASRSLRGGRKLLTVYIGGGTPTALTDDEMSGLAGAIGSAFDLSQLAEFTVEANPGTVDAARFDRLLELGANRLSLGVQTFDDAGLARLGRLHDSAQAAAAFRSARDAGFADISVDLMFALPGQTVEGALSDAERVIALEPTHVSLYGLTYEPGTALSDALDRGEVAPAPEEAEREMYLALIDRLEEAGFQQYEISNFALPGYESIHNQSYWGGGEYVGLGPSAASFLCGRRSRNSAGVDEYVQRLQAGESPVVEVEQLGPERAAREALMLALRTRRGVDRKQFRERTGFDVDDLLGRGGRRFLADGFLVEEGSRTALSRKGLPVADEIFAEII